MNLTEIAKILYRRWWVFVPVVILTAGAVLLTVALQKPRYEATAALLLAGPQIVGSEAPDPTPDETTPTFNPSIVAEIVEGDTTRARLDPVSESADYSVVVTSDGVLRVEVTDIDETTVVPTADAVIDQLTSVVEELNSTEDGPPASLEVLSLPSIAREQIFVGPDGDTVVQYFTSGSVLMRFEDEEPSLMPNPYSPSSGTLRVLQEVASTEAVVTSIQEQVGDETAEFDAVFQDRDAAPIMYAITRASTEQATMNALGLALSLLDTDLADRQEITGADPSTWLQFQRLAVSDEPEDVSGSLRRPIATVLVLGAVASVSLSVLVDTILVARSRRRDEEDSEPADEDEPGTLPASGFRVKPESKVSRLS